MGCKKLLTFANGDEYLQPYQVPFAEELRALRIEPAGKQADRAPTGTMVRIRRGAFTDTLAIVEMSTESRVRLLLECFGGREIAVSFAAADVEVLSRPID